MLLLVTTLSGVQSSIRAEMTRDLRKKSERIPLFCISNKRYKAVLKEINVLYSLYSMEDFSSEGRKL